MRPRIALARFLIRAGNALHAMAPGVMRPDDLIEFGRQAYGGGTNLDVFTRDEVVDRGLSALEQRLLEALPDREGELLVLGVGGGREAIALARAGFRVTGVDFVPEMVSRAVENARRRGVELNGLVQEISQLSVPPQSYDVIWLATGMYSCVPTRKRRVRMLVRITDALRPGGHFVCEYRLGGPACSRRAYLATKLGAWLTLGNLAHERGDQLWMNHEFLHFFPSPDHVRAEFEQAGLAVVMMVENTAAQRGAAVLQKRS